MMFSLSIFYQIYIRILLLSFYFFVHFLAFVHFFFKIQTEEEEEREITMGHDDSQVQFSPKGMIL